MYLQQERKKMKKYLNILQKSSLFSGLKSTEIEAMLNCLQPKMLEYEKNEYIAHADDTIEYIGLLLEGKLQIIQDDFFGNRNIISKVTPSHLFAEAFACTPGSHLYMSVVTEMPSKVLFMNVNRALHTCSSPCVFHSTVIRNLLSDIARKNIQLNEKLTHMTRRTTREKLLSYLSAESLRHNSTSFDIPYNRQQLADYLSVDRSAMSNELCKMRDEGLITFNKTHFDILYSSDYKK